MIRKESLYPFNIKSMFSIDEDIEPYKLKGNI